MIKKIKYNRILSKLQYIIGQCDEEFYHDTDYSEGDYYLMYKRNTLYTYCGTSNELVLYDDSLKKLQVYSDASSHTKNLFYNLLCDYFFENHNYNNTMIYIRTVKNDTFSTKIYEYDKGNKIQ